MKIGLLYLIFTPHLKMIKFLILAVLVLAGTVHADAPTVCNLTVVDHPEIPALAGENVRTQTNDVRNLPCCILVPCR